MPSYSLALLLSLRNSHFMYGWLPMVVPIPAAAVIHAAGNFLIAQLLSLFIAIPCIMNICLIDVIMVLLGVTLTLAQRD